MLFFYESLIQEIADKQENEREPMRKNLQEHPGKLHQCNRGHDTHFQGWNTLQEVPGTDQGAGHDQGHALEELPEPGSRITEKEREAHMEVLAVAVNKGGTGKTTTAAALAWAAASQGKKVLAIDLDPQGNYSLTMGADTKAGGVVDFLEGREVVQSITPGVDMIAASWEAAALQSGKGSARRLQNALAPIRGRYDVAIIDTPPTAGELLYNALQACNGLVIPLFADVYCIQSLYQITATAAQFKQSNPGMMIKGFLLTQTKRGTIYKQMQDTITAKAAGMGVPFLGAVRQGVAISEAAALQKSLFEYAPDSNPARDYLAIYKKIMEG